MTETQDNAPKAAERSRHKGREAVTDAAKTARLLQPAPPPPSQPEPHTSIYGLPPGCPVRPLGVHGDVRFYLDALNQLMELPAKDHGRSNLQGLFQNKLDYVYTVQNWLRHNDKGDVTGVRWENVSADFTIACGHAGVWDVSKHERGRGVWRGLNDELIWHTGDVVWIFERCERPWNTRRHFAPGLIGRDVYPAGESVGGIAAIEPPADIGEQLLTKLERWNWRRSDLDAVLMLGWIGAALIGGALQWRPAVWLTGSKGTGKSTLQKLIKHLMGNGLIDLADATPAYIWQTLRQQTLAVNVDELEATEDNRRTLAIVDLARKAASGAQLGRGSDRHIPISFRLQSCFLFASILLPPMNSADRSRLAILDLQELPADAAAMRWDAADMAHLGTQLRRRLVDCWGRFDQTVEWYRRALTQVGHTSRGGDQFSALLAAADILLFGEHMDEDAAQDWVERLRASGLTEIADDMRDEEQCLNHLLSAPLPVYKNGEIFSVGEWVNRALGRVPNHEIADSRRTIMHHGGCRIEVIDGETFLAVANQHTALRTIYEHSRWNSPAGTLGGWVQALRRLPGARGSVNGMYFGGASAKGVLIPARLIPKPDGQYSPPLKQ